MLQTLKPTKHSPTPSSGRLAFRGLIGGEPYANPYWEQVMAWLVKGCEQGRELTAIDIMRAVWEKRMQLWAVYDTETGIIHAVVVTEITDYPSLKTCTVLLLVGERMPEWLHYLEETLEPWARENRCKTIRGWCREGLERTLAPRGWKRQRVLMEKDL